MTFADTRIKIDRLAEIDAALRKTIVGQEADWKRVYVRARKELQEQILSLSGAERDWPADAATAATAFRIAYSDLRTLSVEHDTKWPVVAINHEDPDYIESARKLRGAIAHLIEIGRRVAR